MNNEEKAAEFFDASAKQLLELGMNECNAFSHAAIAQLYSFLMAQWKDEQVKQLLIEKTKLLSSSAAQDSVKRCTIEEIYRELFNEEMSI